MSSAYSIHSNIGVALSQEYRYPVETCIPPRFRQAIEKGFPAPTPCILPPSDIGTKTGVRYTFAEFRAYAGVRTGLGLDCTAAVRDYGSIGELWQAHICLSCEERCVRLDCHGILGPMATFIGTKTPRVSLAPRLRCPARSPHSCGILTHQCSRASFFFPCLIFAVMTCATGGWWFEQALTCHKGRSCSYRTCLAKKS